MMLATAGIRCGTLKPWSMPLPSGLKDEARGVLGRLMVKMLLHPSLILQGLLPGMSLDSATLELEI